MFLVFILVFFWAGTILFWGGGFFLVFFLESGCLSECAFL